MIEVARIGELKGYINKGTRIVAGSVRGTPLAAIKAFEDNDIVQPILIFKGFEHNIPSIETYYSQYLEISKRIHQLYGDSKILMEPIIFHDAELWRIINTRFSTEIINRFGVYHPCITCKGYYIVIQTLLAEWSGMSVVLGEKPDKKKVFFREYAFHKFIELVRVAVEQRYSVRFLKPMSEYKEIQDAQELIGDIHPFIATEPSCIFRSNWHMANGKKETDEDATLRLINEYMIPACLHLIDLYLANYNTTYKQAEEIIANIFMYQY